MTSKGPSLSITDVKLEAYRGSRNLQGARGFLVANSLDKHLWLVIPPSSLSITADNLL